MLLSLGDSERAIAGPFAISVWRREWRTIRLNTAASKALFPRDNMGGTVMLWDRRRGRLRFQAWTALSKGELKFTLHSLRS